MARGRSREDELESTRVSSLGELQQELEARTKRNKPCLTVFVGSNVGQTHWIDAKETVIGRSSGAGIRLNDDGISRRHARVTQVDGQILIEDLASVNGTFVNEEVISTRALRDGDKIRIGSTTILNFTYHDHLDESFQRQMYDAALRDPLTRAYNRRYFLDQLEIELAFARRHRAELSLLLLDIDHFKKVNDSFGHPAGDHVLVELAQVALRTLRTEDVFARYGGEEFAVICRGVSLPNAGHLGERLRSAVQGTAFDFEGKRLPITVSVGVAGYPTIDATTTADLIAGSDEALYEAKRGGRNRVLLKYGTAQPA